MKKYLIFITTLSILMGCSSKTYIDSFHLKDENTVNNAVVNKFAFNGYTTHWQNVYRQQYRYGNLYKVNVTDLENALMQSKIDIAEDMGITGLQMQEGFFNGLATSSHTVLYNPSVDELQTALGSKSNILVFADRTSETGKKLHNKNKRLPSNLNSYQTKAEDYEVVEAFMLENGKNMLYVVLGNQEQLNQLKAILADTGRILKEYDLKRGWFGAETLIKSVTCTHGNPIDVIGKGMNEGNSWFVFDGYMEFLAKDKIAGWVSEVNLPIVTDVGTIIHQDNVYHPIYGCENYNGLQIQNIFDTDTWLKFVKEKKGYIFRNVYEPDKKNVFQPDKEKDALYYDGYFVNAGNVREINQSDKPFAIRTGSLLDGTVNSMILFNRKGDHFDRTRMWEAIMDRRAVAIGENGMILGPDEYRKALQLLLLDRVYLEEYFGDKLNLSAVTEGNQLYVTASNLYPHTVKGTLTVKLPEQLSLSGNQTVSLQLPANSSKNMVFEINPSAKAMEKLHAVVVQFDWDNTSKSTVASLDLPPAISVHQLLYGTSSGIAFPVAIHNFTNEESVAVKLTMTEKEDPAKVIYTNEQIIRIEKGAFKTLSFDIQQDPGKYIVKTEALGVTAFTQLGIEGNTGAATLTEVDLNGDGIMEYQMENDHVRVTLLTTGARVIEYIVKARNDNVLFKLWPEKTEDDHRPYREREFYPYGGFEDFLGQPGIETHKIYDATVVKKEGNEVQVKMTADFYGNKIEKIFTLYGNSPLLEVRFALNMIHPELNMLGPQPILEIGKTHGVEDKFIVPETDGLHEYIMKPERLYGRIMYLKEGWNAGYDTKEDISFAGSFPVRQPYFLHMWMNLPSNGSAPACYAEFQPWLPLYRKTTNYFSYYMWAAAGSWEKAVQELRDRNLITTQ